MDGKLIAAIGLGGIAGALFLVWCIVQVYDRTGGDKVKEHLRSLLFLLDEQCDHMELPVKRAQTVMAVQALLGWRRLFIPAVMVGFILDVLVKVLRQTGIPDLHLGGRKNR